MEDPKILLAIDPGPEESAFVLYQVENRRPVRFGKIDNNAMLREVEISSVDAVVIEMIACYGMPVGAEVFETCTWIGQFLLAAKRSGKLTHRHTRLEVKMALCRDSKARDPHIRQALIDRYGPGEAKAIGKKAAPGPLFGVSGDVWAALGVAHTYHDKQIDIPF